MMPSTTMSPSWKVPAGERSLTVGGVRMRTVAIGTTVIAAHAAAVWLLHRGPQWHAAAPPRVLAVQLVVPSAPAFAPPPTQAEPAPPAPRRVTPTPPVSKASPPPADSRVERLVTAPTPAAATAVAEPETGVEPGPETSPAPAPPPAAPMHATPGRSALVTDTGTAVPSSPTPRIELPSASAAYLNNPPPAYPALSRRLGEQGRVVLRVRIEPDGTASAAEVRTSSGYERLDRAALEAVLRWRYVPGRRDGVPEAMWFLVPIQFVLE